MAKAKAFDLQKLRNIGVIAHIDAGKTTTSEHLLYYAGAKHKLGGVDEGTTDTDYDPEEQARGITIYSACVPFTWRDCTLNLIDTPGHVDFTAEVERSLRVLDGAVVVFDAQKGVEAQSETVWRQADKYKVPRLVFVNKMDVVGANFAATLEQIVERLHGKPVPIIIPIGSGSPKDSQTPFKGVIDLIEQHALYFDPADKGKTIRVEPIPDALIADAAAARERMFDALTAHDDKDVLTSALLEGQEVPPATIRQLIRTLTVHGLIQPVLCGSGREHIGIQPLLDAITWYLPSPLDRPPVVGTNPRKPDKEEKRKPDVREPFCGLVFKVVNHPNGERAFVRVYSGVLKPQSRAYNPGKDSKELIAKLYHVHADPMRGLEEVPEGVAGDIVVVIGLKDSVTGDTLCETAHPILLEPIVFAEAVVSRSIEPESSADKQKLLDTLTALRREDPTFEWKADTETGQTVMSGMGMLHLEIKQHRMERDFKLKVRVGKPRVSYRETLRHSREVEGVFDRVIGTTPVKAKVAARVWPDAEAKPTRVELAPEVRETLSPAAALALEQAAKGALQSGIYGYPLINVSLLVTAVVEDPAAPPQLNESALAAAASEAVNQAMTDNTILLEPIMAVEVEVPEEFLGSVTGDLNARRAEIDGIEATANRRTVKARVPLARLFDYADKVRSLSQGRASSTMEPKEYRPAPDDVVRGILGTDD